MTSTRGTAEQRTPRVYIRDTRSPIPSSSLASFVMSRNRGKDTSPEVALRKALWSRGLRGYRLHTRGIPGRPDIVFPRARLAIFVHGCFWHGCPKHSHAPKSNAKFWREKFARNRERDARKVAELKTGGWLVLVLWEHEVGSKVGSAVARVKAALRSRSNAE